jgi:hypothetical protein
MKKLIYIGIIVLFLGCNSENAPDCFQASGEIVQESFNDLDAFKRILVFNRVKLYISQGDTLSVVVETGENLLNEIKVRVEDSILKVSNGNSCNYVREYGITKVYVTAPEIDEIRNSSGLAVEDIGLIRFNDLALISEDPEVLDILHSDGDFIMDELDVNILRIRANGLSNFFLKGRANSGVFNAADSDVRVEAGELLIQNLRFFHRSTNKMIVNPQKSLIGRIMSLGDVISKTRPPVVNVEELNRGRLIFE